MRLNCGACILAGALAFGIACAQAPASAPKTISSEELAKLLETPGKVFFLDVREPEEIARLGSVKGYVNIPVSQIEARLSEIAKDKLIVTL
jgi:rhodanese-related sulfurtransferase